MTETKVAAAADTMQKRKDETKEKSQRALIRVAMSAVQVVCVCESLKSIFVFVPCSRTLFLSCLSHIFSFLNSPYDDPLAIAAQVLSLLAFCLSWMWWPTCTMAFVAMVLYQVLWCTRMSSSLIYFNVAIASITSLGNMIIAIYVVVTWKDSSYCAPFFLMTDYHSFFFPSQQYCNEYLWFAIAFICSLLWAATAACLFYFVKSGSHAKWEEKFIPSSSEVAAVLHSGDL